jgi:hypothetical protein
MNAGFTILNVMNQLVDFLVLGANIAALTICIVYRRISSSMILLIVGFGLGIGVWVLQHLAGAVFVPNSMEAAQVLSGIHLLFSIGNPIATALIAGGLYMVFSGMRKRSGKARSSDDDDLSRRRDEEYQEDRPLRRSRNPGSQDMQR